ncbi:MAG: precorrin-6y C5,15-methyltransferase (decarboxylating) subunit CbiE [Intestinibacillus sp.]
MDRHFFIIGAGPGSADMLTREAEAKINLAGAVFTTARFLSLCPEATVCLVGELAAHAVNSDARTVAVLVSGDVGFFSAARRVRGQLLPHGEVELVCGLSSLQYFCAKVGVPYDDAFIRSLHGRQGSLLGAVSYHKKVFALTGGTHTVQSVCCELRDGGLGSLAVHVGENLGAADERIETGTAKFFANRPCGDLAVLLVENAAAVNACEPIRDDMLIRGEVPMTKEEVRWVAVNRLAAQPRDTVWDIGAGTGAVTLELARKASDGLVYAVERKPEAIALLTQNREKLGGYNIRVVGGKAPEALMNLPAPDCVFIGGSGGQLRRILKIVQEKNPAVRVAITAIALETLSEAQTALRDLHFCGIEIVQLSAVRGKEIGPYTMMTANNPVFILSGRGSCMKSTAVSDEKCTNVQL